MAENKSNTQVADLLERIADLLETQNANPFRAPAYREGAQTVRNTDKPLADFVQQDRLDELTDLPNIGKGIAAFIAEYVTDDKSNVLDDLQAQVSPESVIAQVAGIRKSLAERIVEQLHIQTLPELEEAAHDGRLAAVEGLVNVGLKASVPRRQAC